MQHAEVDVLAVAGVGEVDCCLLAVAVVREGALEGRPAVEGGPALEDGPVVVVDGEH